MLLCSNVDHFMNVECIDWQCRFSQNWLTFSRFIFYFRPIHLYIVYTLCDNPGELRAMIHRWEGARYIRLTIFFHALLSLKLQYLGLNFLHSLPNLALNIEAEAILFFASERVRVCVLFLQSIFVKFARIYFIFVIFVRQISKK